MKKVTGEAKNNVVSFWLVNTWDSPNMYRTDISDSGNYSNDGILSRARMFKNNRGRVQVVIKDKRKLHFQVVPYTSHTYPAKILLIHYGLQDKEKRKEKCEFYKIEDDYEKRELDEFYNYMFDDHPKLSPIAEITLL